MTQHTLNLPNLTDYTSPFLPGYDETMSAVNSITGGAEAQPGFFSNIANTILGNLGTVASGTGGLAAIGSAYNRLGSIGEQALAGAETIAQQGRLDSQFKPFTVKVGSTSDIPSAYTSSQTSIGPAGGVNLDLSAQEQLIKNKLLEDARTRAIVQDAPGAMGLQNAGLEAITRGRSMLSNIPTGTADRERQIFNRIRAMQTPEEERRRLALEERLFNQGRSGVSTNMFGGTPEQLALAKAEQEAQNQASLMALQQAQQERMNQANLAATTLGLGQNLLTGNLGLQGAQQGLGLRSLEAAYAPQTAALQLLAPALQSAQLAQRGQLYGTGLFSEGSMAGLNALLGSGLGQANLIGNVGTSLLSGAMGGSTPSADDGYFGLLSSLGGDIFNEIFSREDQT